MDPGKLGDIRAKRLRYLHAVYEKTGGNPSTGVPREELGEELGFSPTMTEDVVDYLVDEGLLAHLTLAWIGITHKGRIEVEESLSAPERATEHFPAIVNVLNVHNVTGSQIQQGSIRSTQSGQFGSLDSKQIEKFLEDLKGHRGKLLLTDDENSEVDAGITTIEAQLSSPRPNRLIMRESLHTIRNVLEGCAGALVASGLLQQLPQILAALGH